MRTINKVILIGNITKDPFVKTTASDKKVATFTVATNRTYKTPSGEIMSEAEFTNCVVWGPLAERAEQFLTKGKLVYIEGHLKTRNIDKEDGSRLQKVEVVATELIFLSKREDSPNNTSSFQNNEDFSDLEDADHADDKF